MNGRFTPEFRAEMMNLLRWRRDVRFFRSDSVETAVLDRCLVTFALAPSIGLSEPWRLEGVDSPASRQAVLQNFMAANAAALQGYADDKARLYATSKLAGLYQAPVQIAVFCDDTTDNGTGLGTATKPETRAYSVVGAMTLFWLALRAEGRGLGWVSIIDPAKLTRDLALPDDWRLVGYLCVGFPQTDDDEPELQPVGWQQRARTLWMESR